MGRYFDLLQKFVRVSNIECDDWLSLDYLINLSMSWDFFKSGFFGERSSRNSFTFHAALSCVCFLPIAQQLMHSLCQQSSSRPSFSGLVPNFAPGHHLNANRTLSCVFHLTCLNYLSFHGRNCLIFHHRETSCWHNYLWNHMPNSIFSDVSPDLFSTTKVQLLETQGYRMDQSVLDFIEQLFLVLFAHPKLRVRDKHETWERPFGPLPCRLAILCTTGKSGTHRSRR
jgi:hypothetical protein